MHVRTSSRDRSAVLPNGSVLDATTGSLAFQIASVVAEVDKRGYRLPVPGRSTDEGLPEHGDHGWPDSLLLRLWSRRDHETRLGPDACISPGLSKPGRRNSCAKLGLCSLETGARSTNVLEGAEA